MPAPGEYKTVQARILAYAQEIGWRYVPRADAEARRGFDPDAATPEERARKASLYFGDLLHAQVRAFNPQYKNAEGALIGEFQRLRADIYGMLVPHEIMEKEFLALAETEGIADIEELNKILERAVNLKNFLKGKDREACVFYKEALDRILRPRRVAEDPHRHGEAAHRLRRADPLRDVPRQTDARPHAAAGDRAGESAL